MALPDKQKTIEIRELKSPYLIGTIIGDRQLQDTLLLKDEKKEKVIDGHDGTKSLKIKDKRRVCKKIVYYIYAFQAKADLPAKKTKEGVSKVALFYKDDLVFVYYRHGNSFPEPDQKVFFRSDRRNRNCVDGKPVIKRYIQNREFRTIADNCNYIGRYTCETTATVMGTTHEVNNDNAKIDVYGTPLNADRVNQKKVKTGNDPKEFNYDALWIRYDEKDKEWAKKDCTAKTFCNIDCISEDKIRMPYSQEGSGQDSVTTSPTIVPQTVYSAKNSPVAAINANDVGDVSGEDNDDVEMEKIDVMEKDPCRFSEEEEEEESESESEDDDDDDDEVSDSEYESDDVAGDDTDSAEEPFIVTGASGFQMLNIKPFQDFPKQFMGPFNEIEVDPNCAFIPPSPSSSSLKRPHKKERKDFSSAERNFVIPNNVIRFDYEKYTELDNDCEIEPPSKKACL